MCALDSTVYFIYRSKRAQTPLTLTVPNRALNRRCLVWYHSASNVTEIEKWGQMSDFPTVKFGMEGQNSSKSFFSKFNVELHFWYTVAGAPLRRLRIRSVIVKKRTRIKHKSSGLVARERQRAVRFTEMRRELLLALFVRCFCLSSIKSRTVLFNTSTSRSPVILTPPSANAARSKSLIPCTHDKHGVKHRTYLYCYTASTLSQLLRNDIHGHPKTGPFSLDVCNAETVVTQKGDPCYRWFIFGPPVL